MELDHVEAFVAIVRRGGFTRAASALHLSQPAVSRRLDLLEREVGQPLFDRTRGGARLTEAGRAFLRMPRRCSRPCTTGWRPCARSSVRTPAP